MTKKLLILALSFLVPLSIAYAASTERVVVYQETGVTADDTTGQIRCFGPGHGEFAFYGKIVFNSGTSTADVTVKYAPECTPAEYPCDSVTDWFTLVTFTQATTSTVKEVKHLNKNTDTIPGGCVRVNVDVGSSGSPNYDITVYATYDPNESGWF